MINNEEFYISIVLSDDNYYITTQKNGVILAFKTEQDGLNHYESSYMEWYQRGHEASMSACLNHMTFRPSIVKVLGLEEIKNMVGPEPHLIGLNHVSGHMTGIPIPDLEVAQKYWDKGMKTQLIK